MFSIAATWQIYCFLMIRGGKEKQEEIRALARWLAWERARYKTALFIFDSKTPRTTRAPMCTSMPLSRRGKRARKENPQCVPYSDPGQRVIYAFFACFVLIRNFTRGAMAISLSSTMSN